MKEARSLWWQEGEGQGKSVCYSTGKDVSINDAEQTKAFALSSASVLTRKVNCDQMNNKINAGMERLHHNYGKNQKSLKILG